jgi:hypothetical protein
MEQGKSYQTLKDNISGFISIKQVLRETATAIIFLSVKQDYHPERIKIAQLWRRNTGNVPALKFMGLEIMYVCN